MIRKFLCMIGIHKWHYYSDKKRWCPCCGKTQEYWFYKWCECIDGEPIE